MTRWPGVQPSSRLDHADDLVAGPVGQRDERMAPAGRVQVRSAHARRERADQDLARAGDGDVRRLDGDPAGVDDDAPHGGQDSSFS